MSHPKRVPAKYWKKSHECFYVWLPAVAGSPRQEVRLDPDADKADIALCQVIAEWKAKGHIPTQDGSVSELCLRFLEHVRANNAKRTFDQYYYFLNSFRKRIPTDLTVADLKPYHVTVWLDKTFPAGGKHPHTDNTRHNAVACVKRVFNWAVGEEYIDHSPLVRLKKPPKTPRGTYLDPAQWQVVLSHIPDEAFHDFLTFALHSGCRPQEARLLEAAHISFTEGLARIPKKDAKGKKRERRIRLDETATMILKKWAMRNPTGPVLRNVDGNPWTPSAINSRFVRLRSKLPFNAHLYLARHSFATIGLTGGVGTAEMAELLGHADKTMILKTYGHVDQCEEHLRKSLTQATRRLA